jgi:hypothetical protein
LVHMAVIADPSVLAQQSWLQFVVLGNPGTRLQVLGLLSELPLFAALGAIFVLGVYGGWPWRKIGTSGPQRVFTSLGL